ncbi:hypothetical protein Ddye_017745 [Dipteronia dyeriana]|uniref:Ubiquitin-like protease family profile domain-containing protein n=1 Tax=Dipteronia dyeriana TaxID=168575 RepID=A0AAD9U9S7_9ROSI|nr:hypothetical protein Ddye_017745 [Dipteronia dyeriana]
MMPRDSHGAVTTARWNVLQSRWLEEDLQMVSGATTSGNRSWHEVDLVLIPSNVGGQHWLVVIIDLILGKVDIFDLWRQKVPHYIRKQQVRPLPWFLSSMLNDAGFHTARRGGRRSFPRENKPFSVSVVLTSTVPQQKKSGNCGPHTLRLIEYLLAGRSPFDWSEDDMGIIREKMAVEIFCNSRPA